MYSFYLTVAGQIMRSRGIWRYSYRDTVISGWTANFIIVYNVVIIISVKVYQEIRSTFDTRRRLSSTIPHILFAGFGITGIMIFHNICFKEPEV
jgi:hypothetical protein